MANLQENKYQEALDRLENITKVPSIFIDGVVKELVDTFQELVDRATPKKPGVTVINKSVNHQAWAKVLGISGFCPGCQMSVVDTQQYCSNCGQALESEVGNG